jgi:putative spermidine/putrescine transport system permease protein
MVARPVVLALLAPALLLIVVFLLVPLIVAAGISLRLPGIDIRAYAELAGGSFATILFTTVRDSALVALACLLLGLPATYIYVRLDPRYLPILMLAVLVPYFTSTLIRSYAWIAILGNQGLINRTLLGLGLIAAPVKLVYTWFGMIVAMVQVQLPLFILPVLAVMHRADQRLVRAAKTLGADPVTAFVTVYLPQVWPGVTAAMVMVFMTTLGFYVTPALLGPPSTLFLSQSIEMRINTLSDQPAAAAQSIVLLALTVMVAWASFRPLRASFVPAEQNDEPRPTVAFRPKDTTALGAGLERLGGLLAPVRWLAFGAIAVITTLLLVGPLLVLFPLSFSDAPYLSFPPEHYSLRWYRAYLTDPDWLSSTALSLMLGLGGAALATASGGMAALAIARLGRTLRAALMLICAVPLVVSPMVLGTSVFYLAARLGWVGSPLILIACYAVLSLPYATLIISAALARFDWQLPQAAATLGARPLTGLCTVGLPLLIPAVAGAFIFSFFLGFDDVNVALFLADPYARPLPILMLDDIRDELNPRTAAVAVIFFVVAVLLCLLQAMAVRGRAYFVRRRATAPTPAEGAVMEVEA